MFLLQMSELEAKYPSGRLRGNASGPAVTVVDRNHSSRAAGTSLPATEVGAPPTPGKPTLLSMASLTKLHANACTPARVDARPPTLLEDTPAWTPEPSFTPHPPIQKPWRCFTPAVPNSPLSREWNSPASVLAEETALTTPDHAQIDSAVQDAVAQALNYDEADEHPRTPRLPPTGCSRTPRSRCLDRPTRRRLPRLGVSSLAPSPRVPVSPFPRRARRSVVKMGVSPRSGTPLRRSRSTTNLRSLNDEVEEIFDILEKPALRGEFIDKIFRQHRSLFSAKCAFCLVLVEHAFRRSLE